MHSIAVVASILLSVVPTSLPSPRLGAVVPVVGSTQGGFGANFKTSLQIHNRTTHEMGGMLVVRPAGKGSGEGIRSIPYELLPHETKHYDDVVAELELSGLASLDVMVLQGGVPTIVARAYDEKGEAGGTTGVSVRPITPKHALEAGEASAVIVPANLSRFRMNIGIRSLGEGARIHLVVYDEQGVIRANVGEMSFPAHYFVQKPVADLVGIAVGPNESVSFEVREGSAIVYATMTDNKTNDPSLQIAPKPES